MSVNVYSDDIAYANDKLVRFATEVFKSASSNVSGMLPDDVARLNSYLDSIDGAVAHVAAEPQLDMPESSPIPVPTAAFPEYVQSENDEVNQFFRLLNRGHIMLVNSQSARLSSGMLPFDKERITRLVSKCRKFLNDYVVSNTPQDLPETSPRNETTGSGQLGV